MTDKPKTCTRCGVDVPSILSGPVDDRDTWWRYVVGFQRRTITGETTMRFRMFKRRWLPERASDVLSETYTELTLCDPCAADLLLIAQGLEPKRTITAVSA
jgi:hypothetical protein